MESYNEKPEQILFAGEFETEMQALDVVQGSLAGSYNESGVELWWHRPRTELGGKAPIEYWKIDPKKVIELAKNLVG